MRLPHPKSSLEHQAPHAARRHEGTVRVRALRRGFYDNHMKEAGDEFTIPADEKPGKWMEVIGELPTGDERRQPEDEQPIALAEAEEKGKLPKKDRRKSENDVL